MRKGLALALLAALLCSAAAIGLAEGMPFGLLAGFDDDVIRFREADAPAEQAAPQAPSGMACAIEPAKDGLKNVILTEKPSGRTAEAFVAQDESIALRVLIGEAVDKARAYVTYGGETTPLGDLPLDGAGFLFELPVSALAEGNAALYRTVGAYPDAAGAGGELAASFTFFASEEDLDAYVKLLNDRGAASGAAGYEVVWQYADGSPKKELARYVYRVLDEDGAPVPGAMLQLCDEDTCLVVVTDAEGSAAYEGPRYPYEIHLLMAPDGYQEYTDVHVMPEEGGELTITLQRIP